MPRRQRPRPRLRHQPSPEWKAHVARRNACIKKARKSCKVTAVGEPWDHEIPSGALATRQRYVINGVNYVVSRSPGAWPGDYPQTGAFRSDDWGNLLDTSGPTTRGTDEVAVREVIDRVCIQECGD